MAADGVHSRGPHERARPRRPLRRRGEEEVGGQLRLHGALRLRGRLDLLGLLGIQDVLRREAPALMGPRGARAQPGLPHRPRRAAGHGALPRRRLPGDGHDRALLPDGHRGVLPVRVRGHHADPDRRVVAGPDELPGVDALRAALAHLLLHRRRLLRLGRRIPLPLGRHRLLRRIRHPHPRRRRGLHGGVLGRAQDQEGQGEVPAKQHPLRAHGSRAAVDGVGGLQRRRAVRGQRRRFHGRAQHQHLHGRQPHRLDMPRRRILQEAIGRRRRPGRHHRTRMHHPRRRCGAGMGGAGDGRAGGQRAVVHHDDPAQAVQAPAAGGRHAGRDPHPRRGGAARRRADGAPRRAHPVQPLPSRDQLARRLLRRHRGRRAAREADRRGALRDRVERGGHVHHLRRHRARGAAADVRGEARRRGRRRARRGGLRPVGRRGALRRHEARRGRRRARRRRQRRRRARLILHSDLDICFVPLIFLFRLALQLQAAASCTMCKPAYIPLFEKGKNCKFVTHVYIPL